MHNVANINSAQSNSSRDRSGDLGISELQVGIADGGLVGLNRARKLAHLRSLSVHLLLSDHLFVPQRFVALQIYLGIVELGGIASQLPVRLFQLNLKGTRIDLGEQISFVHHLALSEVDRDQLSIHPALHRDRIKRSDGAEAPEHDRNTARARGGNYYGN